MLHYGNACRPEGPEPTLKNKKISRDFLCEIELAHSNSAEPHPQATYLLYLQET